MLAKYAVDADGQALAHYTDCFSLRIATRVSLADYVYAFYTAPLFRCERIILMLIGRGSSDDDARRIANGESQQFAAWQVENRTDTELLMCDFQSRTRSWFKVEGDDDSTTLYFGSAVIADDQQGPPGRYRLLLGLHRLYSRLLLRGAQRRLKRIAS